MLPPYYAYDTATEHLESLVSKSLQDDPNGGAVEYPQLSQAKESKLQTAYVLEAYSIVQYQEPPCWKLSTVDRETGVAEPALIRMIGAISDLELPPFPRPLSQQSMDRMRRHLRQSVTLTGLHSESFHRNHAKIEEIVVMFIGALPANSVIPWQPSYEGRLLVINTHNRVFTKRVLVPNRPKEPFHHYVDPHGHLDALQNDMKVIHILDNQVEFYAQDRGTDKTTPTNPTGFRAGDFVELTVEFVAFPVLNNNHKVVITLRAVKMLTPEHRNHASIINMRSAYKTPFGPAFEKKRRALYADPDVEGAGDQLKRMRMSEYNQDEGETQQKDHQVDEGQQKEDERAVGQVSMQVSDITKDP